MLNTHSQKWKNCLKFIEGKITEQKFNTWFKPISAYKYEHNTLTLEVPNTYFYEFLESHYLGLLQHAIHQELGKDITLMYRIQEKNNNNLDSALKKAVGAPMGAVDANVKNPTQLYKQVPLNPDFQFEHFIEGSCNRLARNAALAIASHEPGKTCYNPFLIYGNVGLGKTHLAQAIAHATSTNFPSKNVVYLGAQQFMKDFGNSVKNNRYDSFYQMYCSVDLLILDDVQFLAGKEKTQDFLFNIFNNLHQRQKQIVMTCDRAPKDLQGFEARLLSRFKWGLTAELEKPCSETKVAIIKHKLCTNKEYSQYGMYEGAISDEVIQYLATTICSSIRDIEGVITSLLAHVFLNKKEITLPFVKAFLNDFIVDLQPEINIGYFHKAVARHYSIPDEDLLGKTRKHEIVKARQTAMYFIKKYTKHSLAFIGKYFGGRDHATVIYALERVKDKLRMDRNMQVEFEKIEKVIKKDLPVHAA